jgi:murein DD-endopeptidase MepM/ murein hydrolase activator NlpD
VTRSAWLLAAFLALAVAASGIVLVRAEGDAPFLEAPGELFVGREPRALLLRATDAGSGLRSLRVVLVHADGEAPVVERALAGSLVAGGGPESAELEVSLDAKALGLRDGSAQLRVEARDWSWRGPLSGNLTRLEIPVEVDTRPPRVAVDSGLTYVRRGGAGLVAYRLSDASGQDGVRVGERLYPGIPWPRAGADCGDLGAQGSGCRVALFAVPIDAPEDLDVRVVAEDRAGNRAAADWALRIQPREIPHEPIRLSSRFLEGKVRLLADAWEIDASDPVAAFHEINTRVRARDEARIQELVAGSQAQPLWRGGFQQLANSQVTSLFAEQREYLVEGQVVSRATHYGYDLASTARAPITASGAGRVLHAGPLGIYGDTVLLDHGMGLVSLYGHLSSLDVGEGDSVAQGDVLGRSGATGLAGGDHLHFAVLVGGTYVDPKEWWDPKWVRERVDAGMGR